MILDSLRQIIDEMRMNDAPQSCFPFVGDALSKALPPAFTNPEEFDEAMIHLILVDEALFADRSRAFRFARSRSVPETATTIPCNIILATKMALFRPFLPIGSGRWTNRARKASMRLKRLFLIAPRGNSGIWMWRSSTIGNRQGDSGPGRPHCFASCYWPTAPIKSGTCPFPHAAH
ncbi:MAG: hypothetical protein RLZZ561_167 [Pseudomonadota bacterium]